MSPPSLRQVAIWEFGLGLGWKTNGADIMAFGGSLGTWISLLQGHSFLSSTMYIMYSTVCTYLLAYPTASYVMPTSW